MKIQKLTALVLAGCLSASVLLTGCGKGIDQDAVVAKLGDQEISLGLANFMAQYQAVTYDAYYMSYYGEDMWSKDLYGNGSTLTDQVKSNVMEQIETDYLLEQKMDDYKVEITDDEMKAIEKAAKQFMEDNDGSAAKTMGATEENVKEMLRLELIRQKMQKAIEADVNTDVSDEEAAQKTISYIHVSANGYTDDDGQYTEYTDEEKEALPEKMNALANAAKEDFDGAADEYGYDVSTYSYGADEVKGSESTDSTETADGTEAEEDTSGSSGMDDAVIAAAEGLEEGGVSDLIETESNGYYVVRLDSRFDQDATDKKKKEIVSKRKSDYYTQYVDSLKDKAEWTVEDKVWSKVSFDDLYKIKQTQSTETEAVTDTES